MNERLQGEMMLHLLCCSTTQRLRTHRPRTLQQDVTLISVIVVQQVKENEEQSHQKQKLVIW